MILGSPRFPGTIPGQASSGLGSPQAGHPVVGSHLALRLEAGNVDSFVSEQLALHKVLPGAPSLLELVLEIWGHSSLLQ